MKEKPELKWSNLKLSPIACIPKKMEGCVLKAIRGVSNIANMLLDPKRKTNQTTTNIMKSMSPLIQSYTDLKTTLVYIKSIIEKKLRLYGWFLRWSAKKDK